MDTTTGLSLLDSIMMELKLPLEEVTKICSFGIWRAVKKFSDGMTIPEVSMLLDSFQEPNVSSILSRKLTFLGLASCSDDKTIKIYDLRNNELLQHYNAHAGAVNMIDFHPSGFYMGSVANDSKVKVWDLRKGSALFSLYGHSGAVQSIKFSNAGDYFTTGGDDKMVLVWKSNFFKSNTTEQRAIKKKKRVVNNKLVSFPNKAVAETVEAQLGANTQEVAENDQVAY